VGNPPPTPKLTFPLFQYSAKCNARVTTEFSHDPDGGEQVHLSVIAVSGTHTHEKDPKAVTAWKKGPTEL
jgi:hypothetical protein